MIVFYFHSFLASGFVFHLLNAIWIDRLVGFMEYYFLRWFLHVSNFRWFPVLTGRVFFVLFCFLRYTPSKSIHAMGVLKAMNRLDFMYSGVWVYFRGVLCVYGFFREIISSFTVFMFFYFNYVHI